ncbi:MFS transporter [Mycolicibacterium moriokaense]|uniref:MFS transporter n=2 Tax=Mycolicibacterium moriokaense TaxID=39691 RepID=A0AAD1M7E6_9MYCO|nr:MFS transporter [Mycolicibacterium moriokaense]
MRCAMAGSERPPTRAQAIVVWGLGTLFLGLGLLTAVMIGIVAEQVRDRLEVSEHAIGMLSAVFYVAYSIAQFIGGIMLDRLSPRLILGISSLIAAVGCVILANATSIGVTVAGRVILGIGLSTSFLGAIYLARIWFPPQRFAVMSSVSQLATNVILALMLIGLSVTETIPPLHAAMVGMAVGYVVLGIAILLLVSRPATAAATAAPGDTGILRQLREVVRVPQFWLGTAFFASVFGVLIAWNDLWGIMNQRAYGRTLEMATALTSTGAIAAGVGGLLLGWISDRLGKRSRVTQITIWLLTFTMALVLFLPRLPTAGVFVLLFVFGFLLGSNILGFAQIGQHIPDNAQATAFGLMTSVGFLTGAGLDYVIGVLVGEAPPVGTDIAISHYRGALIPLLVVLSVGALCSVALKDRAQPPSSTTVDPLPIPTAK